MKITKTVALLLTLGSFTSCLGMDNGIKRKEKLNQHFSKIRTKLEKNNKAISDLSTYLYLSQLLPNHRYFKQKAGKLAELVQNSTIISKSNIKKITKDYPFHDHTIVNLWPMTKLLCEHDQNFLLKAKEEFLKKELLGYFLLDPKNYETYVDINKTVNPDNTVIKKTFSSQHFMSIFDQKPNHFFGDLPSYINKRYLPFLQQTPKIGETLYSVINREFNELKKGRYSLYHGRNSNSFVKDLLCIYLLELCYRKTIDQNSWHTLHWNLPRTNLAYEKVESITKNGRIKDVDRTYMQFMSDLFGIKTGSSALPYLLRNRNAGGFTEHYATDLKKLFATFGCEQYYAYGQEEFERAVQLADKLDYGTLLHYSFTSKALKDFTYTTQNSGGYSKGVSIDGKKTTDTQTVLDTLVQNPEKFDDKNKFHEYIMMICDNKNKNVLGSANPFNEDIRTYTYNFGDDEKIADQIKELIELGFMKIQLAMVKDGIIEKPFIKHCERFDLEKMGSYSKIFDLKIKYKK